MSKSMSSLKEFVAAEAAIQHLLLASLTLFSLVEASYLFDRRARWSAMLTILPRGEIR